MLIMLLPPTLTPRSNATKTFIFALTPSSVNRPALNLCLNLISLCNLCFLCVSVVNDSKQLTTTETQRTQLLHREAARLLTPPGLRLFVQSPSSQSISICFLAVRGSIICPPGTR